MTSPAWCAGRSTASRRARLVQGTDEVQALLDQPAEAGVLGRPGSAGRPAGHQHRAPPRLVGQALEERAALRRVLAEREASSAWSTASTVPGGAFSGSAESACIGRDPGVITTTRWPRREAQPARRRA